MECGVCLKSWNFEDCVPKSLPCGHSFCSLCLEGIFARQKTGIQCPNCLTEYEMSLAQVQGIPKNFAILSLLHDKSLKGSFINNIKGRGSKNGRWYGEEHIEKVIAMHPTCDKHKLPLHSYAPETNHFLCDKCVIELPSAVTARPIPKVVPCHA